MIRVQVIKCIGGYTVSVTLLGQTGASGNINNRSMYENVPVISNLHLFYCDPI